MLRTFGPRKFWRATGGVAAVEFALIAPMMAATYMGVAELTLGMMAQRRAAHAASVVGDLVAQSSQMNTAQMTDIFLVGGAVVQPFSSTGLNLRVTSVTADAQASPKVRWSQGHGYGALTVGATTTTPGTLLAAGESVIMTEVSYSYTSPLHGLLPPKTFTGTYFLKPRRSAEVAWTG